MNATYQMESNASIGELNAAQDAMDSASKACDQASAAMKAAHLTVREAGRLRLWLAPHFDKDDTHEHAWYLMLILQGAATVAAREARDNIHRARITYNDAYTSYEMLAGPRY